MATATRTTSSALHRVAPFTAVVRFVDAHGEVVERSRLFELEARVPWAAKGSDSVRAEVHVGEKVVPVSFTIPLGTRETPHVAMTWCIDEVRVDRPQGEIVVVNGKEVLKRKEPRLVAARSRVPGVSEVEIRVEGSSGFGRS